MTEYINIIEQITHDQMYENQFGIIEAMIKNQAGNDIVKDNGKKLLESINIIISQSNRDPKIKFYALQIVKDLSIKRYQQFLGVLSSSKLFQTMQKIAKSTDPKLKMEEKGKKYFNGDAVLGNKFITLILECICYWGQKYQQNSKKQPTQFKIASTQLDQSGVVLPKKYLFFMKKQPIKGTPGGGGQPAMNIKSIEANLRFLINKIQGFFQFLNQNDSDEYLDKLQSEIRKYHAVFQKQKTNVQSTMGKIFDLNPSEDLTNMILKLSEFYNRESQTYKKAIQNKGDTQLYIQSVKEDANVIQEFFVNKIQKKPNNIVTYNDKPPLRNPSNIKNQQQEKIAEFKRQQIQNQNKYLNSKLKDRQSKVDKKPEPLINIDLRELEAEKQLHQTYLNKYLAKTSNSIGFRSIRQQLEREQRKRDLSNKVHYQPARKSKSPVNQLKPKMMATTFSNIVSYNQQPDNIKMSVFELHTQPILKNNYSGMVVTVPINFYRQMSEMSVLDVKRFKMANFKNKSLLFQNQYLQVGFKSEIVEQEVQNMKNFLLIALYFGNKCETSSITSFQIQYEGDATNILYHSPSRLPSTIDIGAQNKQELIICPIQFPFTLLKFNIRFRCKQQIQKLKLTIPNSILKFVIYQKITNISTFKKDYKNIKSRNNLYRSSPFNLSRTLPPAALKKYLSTVTEKTNYQQFIAQKSYLEYKLIIGVIILDNQYLLKIRIRPDMTVVLQLGILRNVDEESIRHGKFFLQSFQFLLQKQN